MILRGVISRVGDKKVRCLLANPGEEDGSTESGTRSKKTPQRFCTTSSEWNSWSQVRHLQTRTDLVRCSSLNRTAGSGRLHGAHCHAADARGQRLRGFHMLCPSTAPVDRSSIGQLVHKKPRNDMIVSPPFLDSRASMKADHGKTHLIDGG
jgi:hypothetical protein